MEKSFGGDGWSALAPRGQMGFVCVDGIIVVCSLMHQELLWCVFTEGAVYEVARCGVL